MEENNVTENLDNVDEISFEDIWAIFVRRWFIILLCTITAVVAGYFYYDSIVPLYRSTSTLLVQVPGGSSASTYLDPMGNYSASEKWARTYAEMIKGDPILKEVTSQINYPTFTVADIKSSLAVSVMPDTMLLKVSYDYEKPAYAKKVVDTVNNVFIKKINEMYESSLEEGGKKLQDQINTIDEEIGGLNKQQMSPDATIETKKRLLDYIDAKYKLRAYLIDELQKQELMEKQLAPTIKVYQEGTKSDIPINKNFMLILAICLVLGLFIGVLLAFFIEYLDDTIKSENDLKKITNKRVLGNIFYYNPGKEKKGYYYYQSHYKKDQKSE
jgi:capsular polysaccharide biosynthesis protein